MFKYTFMHKKTTNCDFYMIIIICIEKKKEHKIYFDLHVQSNYIISDG